MKKSTRLDLNPKHRSLLSGYSIQKNYLTLFNIFCAVIAVMWFASILMYGRESYQLRIFFRTTDDYLADFFNVVGYCGYNDPYNCTAYSGLEQKGYPPMTYFLFRPFGKLVDMDSHYETDCFLSMRDEPKIAIVFMIIAILITIAMYEVIRSNIKGSENKKRLCALVFIASSPVIFTLERGNVIILAALASMFFIFYYDSPNPIKKEAALLSLGFAFSLKISPAVLGMLLISNKQWKEAARAAVYGILMFMLPFLSIKGGFSNIPLFIRNMGYMSDYYYGSGDCTFRAAIQRVVTDNVADIFIGPARIIVGGFFVICSLFMKRKWEKVLMLSFAILYIPTFSSFYNLLYLFPAAILFLNEEDRRNTDIFALASFIVIIALRKWHLRIFNRRLALLVLTVMMFVRGTTELLKFSVETAAKNGRPQLLQSSFYKKLTGEEKLIDLHIQSGSEISKKARIIRMSALIVLLLIVLAAAVIIKL